MAKRRMLRAVVFVGCVLVSLGLPDRAPAQEPLPLRERVARIAAQFFGVPEELLDVMSIGEDEPSERPTYALRATIVTPDGRPVSRVVAHIDVSAGYVVSAGRLVFAPDEALAVAETFARASFPAWSDSMALQEMSRDGDQIMCRWAEKIADVWTGNYVGLTVSLYRPGVPQTYVAYIGAERSPDVASFTAGQAQEALRNLLMQHGYESDLRPGELHLDDLNWQFPSWWIPYRIRRAGAPADALWMEGIAIVDAVTGEVVEPKLDE